MMSNKNRGRIRPPRRGLDIDQVDFNEVWDILSQSLDEIHNKNASSLSFEALYRNAYKLVLKKHGATLYKRVKDLVTEHLQHVAVRDVRPLVPSIMVTGGNMIGSAAIEKRVGGSRFLEQLQAVWEDHLICMGMITDVLMYMNRIFCADHQLPTTYTTGMALFREHILCNPEYSIGKALTSVILDQIRMEREGDVINHRPIKSCVYMLECLYESPDEIESEKVYLTSFEGPFLETSSEFYAEEAQRLLRECDAATYLRKTDRRLREEADRCVDTLSTLTEGRILAVVEHRLITENIHEVMEMDSGIAFMLDNDKFDDLELLYKLVARVDPHVAELKEMACARLIELGQQINANLKNPVVAPGAEENGDPAKSGAAAAREEKAANSATVLAIRWVEAVLELKDKYDRIWELSFNRDKGVQTAITRAFTQFINELKEAPEFISLFIDDNLRRGIKGKSEDEVDALLDKAVTLFRYLQDKDLFEEHYKVHLSRRLLYGRSLSHEAEKQVISKLKVEVGVAFTSRLEGMFKDMNLSAEMTDEYRKMRAENGASREPGIDLGINILTPTFWPGKLIGSDPKTCIYPPAIEAMRESFNKYYLNRHTGRKLTWKPNMGTADLRATFKGRKHEFNVPTFGMVILLAFNDLPQGQDRLSFEDLRVITAIPKADLIRNLQSLAVAAKTRLLLKTPMSKDVKPTDVFEVNDQFTSKQIRIKVNIVAGTNRAESEQEKKETDERLAAERKHMIEAAVVRTMKQRKQLSHQELVMEVVDQLKTRFPPEMKFIKTRIESLIEREYLERVEGSRETYRYLA